VIEIDDPPAGSRVRLEREHASVTLTWRARPWDATLLQRAVEYVKKTATRVLIAGWGMWFFRTVFDMFTPLIFTGWRVSHPLIAFVRGGGAVELALVCLVGGCFTWAAWDRGRRLKRTRPVERLVIADDTLIHTPSSRRNMPPYLAPEEGPGPAPPSGPDAPPPSHTWPSAFLKRCDAGELRLAGKGASEIIALATGEGDLTIGRRLPRPDREWLVEVLKAWKEQGS